jgi:hypothetical protein
MAMTELLALVASAFTTSGTINTGNGEDSIICQGKD